MYFNLKKLLEQKNVNYNKLAEFLSVSERTVTNKISGKTEWTFGEVRRIKEFLFPEYDIEFLFKFTDKQQTA